MLVEQTHATKYIALGHVTGTHGLQGWIKVHSDTQPRENITTYPRLYLRQAQQWQPWTVKNGRRQGKYIILKLAGCTDCDQAEALIGAPIAIPNTALPAITEPDQYYWADLIGLTVENCQGDRLGTVDHLIETGVHDVLVLSGDRERLIPFVWQQVVQQVDLTAKRIQVDWDQDF